MSPKIPALAQLDVVASTSTSLIVRLSDTEIGKILWRGSRHDTRRERDKLVYANGVNDLLVRFLRLDEYEQFDMVVMERVLPLQSQGLSLKEKWDMLEIMAAKLDALHQAGFAHCDLGLKTLLSTQVKNRIFDLTQVPHGVSEYAVPGELGNNNCYTVDGIRVYDAGAATLRDDVPDYVFDQACRTDRAHVERVKRSLQTAMSLGQRFDETVSNIEVSLFSRTGGLEPLVRDE